MRERVFERDGHKKRGSNGVGTSSFLAVAPFQHIEREQRFEGRASLLRRSPASAGREREKKKPETQPI